ncbi:MAG: hypothetical protein ABI162_05110 [Luteolibacter sp.]
MSMSYPKIVSILFFSVGCACLHATGDFESPTLLSDGGRQVIGTPEFFWELECKRIALEFVPDEKRVVSPDAVPAKPDEEEVPSDRHGDFTTAMDLADFKKALQDGSLKPADPDAAIQIHVKARDVVSDASSTRVDAQLPDESPGEFAEYHQGALAYKTRHPEQARAAWTALLAKPTAERKYRSTWAAYMLGRCALDENEFAKAVQYFQQTRKLAKEGCIDSLGLAAESYGWEARCELELGHSESSARLYLNQLATGDSSAVVSLKWFIPDWGMTVKGVESAKPGVGEPEAGVEILPVQQGPAASVPRGANALAAAVRSPLLRRLVSIHILATTTPVDNPDSEYRDSSEPGVAQAKWLEVLDRAGVKDTPDAEYLGWIAYSAGKYDDAKRWLAKSPGTSAATLWLQAKLLLREGKITEAAKLLSKALRVFPLPHEGLENSVMSGGYRVPSETASGELGVLKLAQSDFIQALDAFLAADLWADAAYVAERCLTKAELLDYTRKQKFAEVMPKKDSQRNGWFLPVSPERFRDLVARRMVREDDYLTAKEFFAPDKIKMLDDYTTALAKGADVSKPKSEQARALFHAAWIARYLGMELMGTEVGPDNSSDEGAFNDGDLAMARLTGRQPVIEDTDEGSDANKRIQFVLPVTQQEKDRLQATKLVVERRFHYRHVAAGLAWKAAGMLPDNSDEAADVLNSAGNWLNAKHEKQAERFIQALEKRCPKTEIGKQAVTKHGFVEIDGPWSTAERKLIPPE